MTALHTFTSQRRRKITWPVALWSRIRPGLWMGGTDDEDVTSNALPNWETREITPEDFDAVVTMYAWARPVDWGVEELRWGIMDSERENIDMHSLRETVVWTHRRWKAGKKVLVRCQAGMNRSGLVTALVLVRDGMEPGLAIHTVRSERQADALFNDAFADLIRETPAEFWRD